MSAQMLRAQARAYRPFSSLATTDSRVSTRLPSRRPPGTRVKSIYGDREIFGMPDFRTMSPSCRFLSNADPRISSAVGI